jgi:hypothetical protein
LDFAGPVSVCLSHEQIDFAAEGFIPPRVSFSFAAHGSSTGKGFPLGFH